MESNYNYFLLASKSQAALAGGRLLALTITVVSENSSFISKVLMKINALYLKLTIVNENKCFSLKCAFLNEKLLSFTEN